MQRSHCNPDKPTTSLPVSIQRCNLFIKQISIFWLRAPRLTNGITKVIGQIIPVRNECQLPVEIASHAHLAVLSPHS